MGFGVIIPGDDFDHVGVELDNLLPSLRKQTLGVVQPVFAPPTAPDVGVEPRRNGCHVLFARGSRTAQQVSVPRCVDAGVGSAVGGGPSVPREDTVRDGVVLKQIGRGIIRPTRTEIWIHSGAALPRLPKIIVVFSDEGRKQGSIVDFFVGWTRGGEGESIQM